MPTGHSRLRGGHPVTGRDGEHVATREQGMTLREAELHPRRDGAASAGGLGTGGPPCPCHSPCGIPCGPSLSQAREGREPPPARHSPCKASLALASSCSFWASWTLSSVAVRTSGDLPPCDSSRSFVSISFICRRRWTSSWSRATSPRRSTRGEGTRLEAGVLAHACLVLLGSV